MHWRTELHSGHSSPVIWGHGIFLTAFDADRKRLETLSIDRSSGQLLWQRDAPTDQIEKVSPVNSPATPTPVTDGQTVYVYFGSYGLIAYDFSGAVRWRKPLPAAITRFNYGSATSPILIGDRLILDMHLDQDSHLLALDSRTGKTLWKSAKPLFNFGWSTPVTWREGDDGLVGILNGGKFTAHDLNTGKEQWCVYRLPNQICATPVVGDGVIYLTGTGVFGERQEFITPPPFAALLASYDANKDGRISTDELPDTLLVVDRKASNGVGNMSLREFIIHRMFILGSDAKSKTFTRQEWEKETEEFHEFAKGDFMKTAIVAVRTGGKGDVTDSHVVWTEARGVPEVPSPLLYANRLFLVKNGGVVLCRDAGNGRVLFEERINAPGGYYASPVGAAGKVYFASDRGVVSVIEAADKLRVLGRIDLSQAIMATPALADGEIYVRTSSHLYALRASSIR